LVKTWLVTVKGVGMSEYGTRLSGLRIGIPEEILLDGNRESLGQSAIYSIGPVPLVGVAVMRIQSGALTRYQTGVVLCEQSCNASKVS
jgi:hypothetical protein